MFKQQNREISLFLGIFIFFGFTGLASGAESGRQFSDRNFRGSYGYSFEAQFGEDLAFRAVEAGVFFADGKGALTGKGTAVTEGAGPIEATYDCLYDVNPDGRVHVDCDRTTPVIGTVKVEFLLVLMRGAREARFVGIPTVGPFTLLRLIGTAIRQ